MERIERKKLISFKEFMKNALYGEKGYYRNKTSLTEDFITPSNFSLALSFIIKNFVQKRIKGFKNPCFLEIGGGEGIFAQNFLKIFDIKYYFLEFSDSLLNKAKKKLKNRVSYFNDIDEIEKFEGFILAIELFDAFPFRRLIKKNGKFYEIYVSTQNFEEELFEYTDPFLQEFDDKIKENVYFEYSDDIMPFLKHIRKKLKKGYFIVIDYMENINEIFRKKEGTARVFFKHKTDRDFYKQIGKKDITRTINMDFLIKKFETSGFKLICSYKMQEFILKESIDEIFKFERELDIRESIKFKTQLNYLLHPEAMGEIFKILVFERFDPF